MFVYTASASDLIPISMFVMYVLGSTIEAVAEVESFSQFILRSAVPLLWDSSYVCLCIWAV